MRVVIFAFFFELAIAQSCYDSEDRLVNGRCFKLVNKQLSYNDAQNWCHYHNPVTPSFLATIPDPTTSNFMASYARTSFGTNEGYFWIGLSRQSSSSQYLWDDGTRLGWTNFQIQSGQNYVAESISNGKWNTYSADTKLNFICSYDPNAPPTFNPFTEFPTTISEGTTSPASDSSYTPQSNSTFLFAYSNDFDPQIVKDAIHYGLSVGPVYGNFSKFGSIRFDTKNAGSLEFFDDRSFLKESVYSNFPDPSLGFSNNQTGSDILNVLQRFLKNSDGVPLCGSQIFILLKRHPLETDTSELLAELQQNHIFITTLMSNSPILGKYYKVMYDLSGLTNGLAGFVDESNMYIFGSTLQFQHVPFGTNANYSGKLVAEYSNAVSENLQLRIWLSYFSSIDYWLPFPSWN